MFDIVAACAKCPTIHGCIVSVFVWFYLSLIVDFSSVTSVSASVYVTSVFVQF